MTRTLTLTLALAGVLPAAAAPTAADAQRGATKVQMCIGCHGIPGYRATFPAVYSVPKIAGQDALYIAAALEAYRSGDRRYPTMRSVAASLSEQDIADISAYYASLGSPEGPVPGAPARPVPASLSGRLANCVPCHGANFSSPTDPATPRLAGQYADYLLNALRAYQAEDSPHFGRRNATMRAQAVPLARDDLDAIADYLASLPGELRTVARPGVK